MDPEIVFDRLREKFGVEHIDMAPPENPSSARIVIGPIEIAFKGRGGQPRSRDTRLLATRLRQATGSGIESDTVLSGPYAGKTGEAGLLEQVSIRAEAINDGNIQRIMDAIEQSGVFKNRQPVNKI